MPATDAFSDLMMEAFPEKEWTPEQLDSLKLAVKECIEGGEEYEEPEGEEGEGKKKPGSLALIFGGGKG